MKQWELKSCTKYPWILWKNCTISKKEKTESKKKKKWTLNKEIVYKHHFKISSRYYLITEFFVCAYIFNLIFISIVIFLYIFQLHYLWYIFWLMSCYHLAIMYNGWRYIFSNSWWHIVVLTIKLSYNTFKIWKVNENNCNTICNLFFVLIYIFL